jgi:hypothetical protein
MAPHPRPYDGMSNDELTDLARRTLLAASEEPVGSVERAVKFAAYDSVVAEAQRRVLKQMSAQMNAELGLPDIDL